MKTSRVRFLSGAQGDKLDDIDKVVTKIIKGDRDMSVEDLQIYTNNVEAIEARLRELSKEQSLRKGRTV